MRTAIAVLLLASACGPPSTSCDVDRECNSDEVCARDQQCTTADSVRTVRITWTVGGQPASTASCATIPTLYITFRGFSENDTLGFAPVPCSAGLFTIDKLPTRYSSAEIGEDLGFELAKPIDASGNVAFDLVP